MIHTSLGRQDPLRKATSVISLHDIDSNLTISMEVKNNNPSYSSPGIRRFLATTYKTGVISNSSSHNQRHYSLSANRPNSRTSLGRQDPLRKATSLISLHNVDSNSTISKEVKNHNTKNSSHSTSIGQNVKFEVPVVAQIHRNGNGVLYNKHKLGGSERNENGISLSNLSTFEVNNVFLLITVQISFPEYYFWI